MKKNEWDLFEPSRQSLFAMIFIILKFIRRIVRIGWPIILGIFIGRSSGTDRFELMITMIGSLSMITSIIAYFRYYYYIKGEELVIESGLFSRTKLGIPFDRIQTVNFNRTILHRIFDVVEVEVDTAGSSMSEIKIDALSLEKAHALRDYLLSQKAQHTTIETVNEEGEIITVSKEVKEELVLDLSLPEVLRIGVTQNHLRSTGVIFGALFALTQGVDIGMEDFERLLGVGKYSWLAMFVLLAIASFLISVVRSGLQYYNLQLWRTDEKYRMEAGLFTRREVAALDHKIQVIHWSDNLLKRILGYFDVYMKQASSQALSLSKSIAVPGLRQPNVTSILQNWLDEKYQPVGTWKGVSEHYFRRRIMYTTLFFLLIGCGMIYVEDYYSLLPFVGFYIFLSISAWLRYVKRGYFLGENVLYTSMGRIGDNYAVTMLHKIQSVQIRQTPYQSRRNLATLMIYTASGSLSIPYIPIAEAKELMDVCLYRVERSSEAWM